jgi:glucose-1-phosphate adenylyltransferase
MKVTTLENYYQHSMELLKDEVREGVFGNPDHRIYTKVRDSVPTKYGKNAKVENSFIADGTEIEGTVINSILFRGAKVGKNTVVENSIIMQDTIIGDNVKLNCVVTDKNVTIKDRNNLSGCEKLPYYVSKNVMI